MKKSRKQKFLGLSFLLIALCSNTSGTTGDDNIKNYIKGDCESVADFIEGNLSSFVSEYNKENEIHWLASGIEDRKTIVDVTDGSDAVYLDFDGDNGYAVIGNDYNFLDFSQTGDLEYLKKIDNILFSEYDGFVYETDTGYACYDTEYGDENFWSEIELKKIYSGQDSEGSGMIRNSDDYIHDRYGNDFYLDTDKRLRNYENVQQKNYSLYYDKNGVGEGNCTLSAMFGIMRYLRDNKGMSSLPSETMVAHPEDDSFYDDLIGNGYTTRENKDFPLLYETIREAAKGFGYTCESSAWTSINMANVYMNAMNKSGYYTNVFYRYAYLVLTWSYESQVIREINYGYPTMWNTAIGQYDAHSMVVNGYRIYAKIRKIWFFTLKEQKVLASLNDNWGDTDVYMDCDAFRKNECLMTFLQVRNYAF